MYVFTNPTFCDEIINSSLKFVHAIVQAVKEVFELNRKEQLAYIKDMMGITRHVLFQRRCSLAIKQ